MCIPDKYMVFNRCVDRPQLSRYRLVLTLIFPLLLVSCVVTPVKIQPKVTICPADMVLRLKPVREDAGVRYSQNEVSDIKSIQKQEVNSIERDCIPKEIIEIAEIMSVDSNSRELFDQATELLARKEYELAISLLHKVTESAEKLINPYINLGIAYSLTNQLAKAEVNLNLALALNVNHPVANNELAVVYRKLGRYVEARSKYELILQQYPEFLPARKNLGVLCDIYIQDLQCATEQYEFYLRLIPEDKDIKIWKADVKNRMARP